MQLEALSCNNCGASLSVPETANFVTCNHCSTRLAIRRTESTTFTEQLEQIESKQAEMLDSLKRLEQQNRLAEIDRAWEREQRSFLTTDKHGRQHMPNEGMAVLGGVLVVGFGIFWTILASQIGGSGFAIFGVLFILLGIVGSSFKVMKAKDYRDAQRRYHRRRSELLRWARSVDESPP